MTTAELRLAASQWPWVAFARRVPSPLRDCRTAAELEHEALREELRNQRWRRWRSMIATAVFGTSVLTGAIPVGEALDAVLSAVGTK